MLCLFIVEVSSQLAFPSLPQDHGQSGMLGENQLLFLVLCGPPNIGLFEHSFSCFSRTMLNAGTHIHSFELPLATAVLCCWPVCCSTDAAEGLCCRSHLDRSCRETGERMLFMSFPVKISPHSSRRVFSSQAQRDL